MLDCKEFYLKPSLGNSPPPPHLAGDRVGDGLLKAGFCYTECDGKNCEVKWLDTTG
jgi:hypothetical protein